MCPPCPSRKALPGWGLASPPISRPFVTARTPPKACAPSRNGAGRNTGRVRPLARRSPAVRYLDEAFDFVGSFRGAGSARPAHRPSPNDDLNRGFRLCFQGGGTQSRAFRAEQRNLVLTPAPEHLHARG